MRKLQLAAAALTLAVLAFATLPQARADVYDYGYGPVYSSYPVTSGTTCPNGQCTGSNCAPVYSSYPTYGATCPNGSCGVGGACTSGTCPNGTCGSCPNGMCGLRGSCASGQCASGQCPNGQCSTGQCSDGSCRSGRCRYCPNGDCDLGRCSGNCPNGQCTTRYRGPVDSLSPPNAPVYDRPDYGTPDGPRARPLYSTERPLYREYRDSDHRDRERDGDHRDRERYSDHRDRDDRDRGFRDTGYRDRDFRDRASLEQPVSHRTWRNDSRQLSRDGQMESPFYN
jgi:hypothetical protein